MELHLELVGAPALRRGVLRAARVARRSRRRSRRTWRRACARFKALAKFDPYIAGKELTLADCAAFVHLPLVSLATKLAYGRDFLEDAAAGEALPQDARRAAGVRAGERRPQGRAGGAARRSEPRIQEYLRFLVTLTAVLDPFLAVPIFLGVTASRDSARARGAWSRGDAHRVRGARRRRAVRRRRCSRCSARACRRSASAAGWCCC